MKKEELIKETTEELLKNLKVEAEVEVGEKEGAFHVQIETPDSGLLIGSYGETLSDFQLILSLMIFKKLDEWCRLVVNVGDYRQRREETLRQMAEDAAERTSATGKPIALPNLSSFDRRIVHLALLDHSSVTTVSEGEGKDRVLIVKPREQEK